MSERLPIWKVVNHLENNIDKIKTVNEWSRSAGYSKTYFLHSVQQYYGITPDVLLRGMRLLKIIEELHENPGKISYAIARDVGLKDDNSLCYFVRRYFGITPKKLKKKVRDYLTYTKLIKNICNENNLPFNSFSYDEINEGKRLVA